MRPAKDMDTPQPQKQENYPNLNKGNPGNKGSSMKHNPEELAGQLIEHFTIEPNYEKELPHYKDGEVKWTDYKIIANRLPTFLGFSQKIGVNTLTLERWNNKRYKIKDPKVDPKLWGKPIFPKWCRAYARAKELQKFFIIENGLNNLYNPQFAIFVAKNITDMKDKTETDQNIKGTLTIKMTSYKESNG